MKTIFGWIKWLFGFAKTNLKEIVASGLNVSTARALVKAYIDAKRNNLANKAREAIKKAAEEGRTSLILELKSLDDHAANVLRSHGFTVAVDETAGSWTVSW